MRTLYRLLRAGAHTVLLFALPWLTGALIGSVADVAEVSETAGAMSHWFAAVVVPLLLLQLIAITIKVSREMRARRAGGARGFGVFVDALDRHARLLTGRGLGAAAAALAMVAISLSFKWAQFGVLAVAGLGVLYLAATAATLVSAFSVRAFDDRVKRGRGSIEREMSPTVVDAGDAVEERFILARVPVPPGFRVHIEEELPSRLGGDTRFALDRSISRKQVTVSAPLPRTPRGVYRVGPAAIWYEDVLGLTRVFVAARASASLRALPRLRPVVFQKTPRSVTRAEGPLAVLSRLATEEFFRTRPYVNGDDLRRVHWKQSINTGQLVVRVPESISISPSKVRLVLDTYLPPGWRHAGTADGRGPRGGEPLVARAPEALDDVLDLLVEAWIGLAHALSRRGESVSLLVAIRGDGVTITKEIECKRGEERKWRAVGSDVTWQNDLPVEAVVATSFPPATRGGRASTVVVSAGLSLGGGGPPAPGTSFVVADGASTVLEPPRDDLGPVRRFFFFDYPVGADDNRVDWRSLFAPKPPAVGVVREELAKATSFATSYARASACPVLLVRRRGPHLSLEAP